MCGRWKSRGLLRGLDNSLPARTKEAESGGVRVAELFTQSRSLPLYGAPTFHWHLTFVFKESKVTKRPLSPLLSSLSPLQASNCKQKEEFVCVCRLYAKTGIFAECIPLRVPVGSLSQKTSALFLMTFSSAIFLPSKVANPANLSLPFIGVSNSLAFSPFSPEKGMAMPSFCHTLHHPCCGPGEHDAN